MEAFPTEEGHILPVRPRALPWRAISVYTLAGLLGAIFIFSAVAKLFPITGFEWLIRDTGFFSGILSGIAARLLIALELLLGICLLFSYRLRAFSVPVSAVFVTILSGYLLYRMKVQGTAGNCGCFGDVLRMTPEQALYKNAGLLLLFAVLFWLAGGIKSRGRPALALFIALTFIAAVFLVQPVRSMGNAFPLRPLHTGKDSVQAASLSAGRHVVAFMSLTCTHCRHAAKKMAGMYKADSTLPFYLVLAGNTVLAADFFSETGAENIPHQFLDNPDYLKKVTGGYVPTIFWLEDGKLVREVSARELQATTVKTWVGPKISEYGARER